MPFSRQRPDQLRVSHQSISHPSHHSTNHATLAKEAAHAAKGQKRRHKAHRSHGRKAHATLALSGAAILSHGARAHARPSEANPPGVWGWTSGAQTFIRSRPGALTAPVAKVSKHTKLFVWGKFDGWYRVETPDHVFGWVYNSYLNAPEGGRLLELSHRKVLNATRHDASQTMYGSPELLRRHLARYGAPGAARGLEKHGIYLAAHPKPHPAKAHPALVQAPRPHHQMAAAPQLQTVSLRSQMPGLTSTNAALNVPVETSDNSVIGGAPAANATANGTTSGTTSATTAPEQSAAEKEAENRRQNKIAAEREARVAAQHEAEVQKQHAAQEQAARQQAEHLARLKAQREARLSAQRQNQQRAMQIAAQRQAEHNARAARWEARRRELARREAERQARRIAARENLRRQMGMPATAVPPTSSPQVAPVSPDELMRARDAFHAPRSADAKGANNAKGATSSNGATPATPPATVSPTSTDGAAPAAVVPAVAAVPAVAVAPAVAPATETAPVATAAPIGAANPAPIKIGHADAPHSAARPAHATSAHAPFRGGSPRDYARLAANERSEKFGHGLANQALTYRGMPYIYGASSPDSGFDCSGLIYYMLRQRGLNPPRTAAGYANYGQAVNRNALKPGDIVLFANTYKRGISHIGVYIGNGNFVHAANPGKGVIVTSLDEPYYANKYWGARRVQ